MRNTGNTTKRLDYFDVAKAISILIIISYHIIAPCKVKNVLGDLSACAVIFFFFAFGYFSITNRRPLRINALRRVKQILVPYISYSLIIFMISALYYIFLKGDTILEVLYCVRNFYCGGIWDSQLMSLLNWEQHDVGQKYMFLACYWFMFQMLISSIVYFFMLQLTKNNIFKQGLFILILFFIAAIFQVLDIHLIANLHYTPIYIAFMMCGSLFRVIDVFDLYKSLNIGKSWIWGLVIIMAIFLLSIVYFDDFSLLYAGRVDELGITNSWSLVLLVLSSFLYIICIIFICKFICGYKLDLSILTWIGKNSLCYYLTHMFIAWVVSKLLDFELLYSAYTREVTNDDIWFSLVVLLMSLVLCTVFTIFRNKLNTPCWKKIISFSTKKGWLDSDNNIIIN